MEADLKRVAATREVATIGGPKRASNIVLDPQALHAVGITIAELQRTLQSTAERTRRGYSRR